jgi:urocanate hydratase
MEYKPIKAPTGKDISCKSWHQEAAMRMLMNNLDQEVCENPQARARLPGTGNVIMPLWRV